MLRSILSTGRASSKVICDDDESDADSVTSEASFSTKQGKSRQKALRLFLSEGSDRFLERHNSPDSITITGLDEPLERTVSQEFRAKRDFRRAEFNHVLTTVCLIMERGFDAERAVEIHRQQMVSRDGSSPYDGDEEWSEFLSLLPAYIRYKK